jgi:hypothetical protein
MVQAVQGFGAASLQKIARTKPDLEAAENRRDEARWQSLTSDTQAPCTRRV